MCQAGFSRETLKTMGRKERGGGEERGERVGRRKEGRKEREGERREGKGEREGERDHKKSAHRIPEADKHWLAGGQRLTSSWLAGGLLKGHQHSLLQEDQAFCAGQTCT